MSEEKKIETQEEKQSTIDINVSLVLAENSMLKGVVEEKEALIGDLTKKLQQATDLIEQDTKSRIIAEIQNKTTVPTMNLANKSVEDLNQMKKVLDTAIIPAFKSGTPMVDKKNPKLELDNLFNEFSKVWRKN